MKTSVLKKSMALGLILLCLAVCLTLPLSAAESERVYDPAKMLNATETAELTALLNRLSTEHGVEMYLATYLALNLDRLEEITAAVEKICVAGQEFMDNNYQAVAKIVADFDFNRIVYLGNIALKGVAQESALKMLELTAGKVATMYDSQLGFRHGPKSIIDDNTLTVAYLSDDDYRRRYELDLIKEMAGQRKGNKIAVVYNKACEGIEELADFAEVAACGTAVVVTPVGKIVWGDKIFDYGLTEIGPTLKKLYDEMTGIQYGELPDTHNWLVEC